MFDKDKARKEVLKNNPEYSVSSDYQIRVWRATIKKIEARRERLMEKIDERQSKLWAQTLFGPKTPIVDRNTLVKKLGLSDKEEESTKANIKLQQQKIRLDRARTMFDMYKDEHLSLQKIGNQFGITRERVKQIIIQFFPAEYEVLPTNHTRKPLKTFTCVQCKKSFWHKNKRKFCSKECRDLFFAPTPEKNERKKESSRKRTRLYYHNVLKKRPDFKEIIRAQNKLFQEKRKKLNVKIKYDEERINGEVEETI